MWNPHHLLCLGQVGMKLAQGISIGCKNHIADRKTLVPITFCRLIPCMQVVHERAFEALNTPELRLTRSQQLISSPEQHYLRQLAEPQQQLRFQRSGIGPQFISLSVFPSITSDEISHYVVELSAHIGPEGAKFGDDQVHRSLTRSGGRAQRGFVPTYP